MKGELHDRVFYFEELNRIDDEIERRQEKLNRLHRQRERVVTLIQLHEKLAELEAVDAT